MNTVTVYTAWKTIDELGQTGRLIGVFTEPSVANKAILRMGWYGGDGKVIPKLAIIVDDNYYILDDRISSPIKINVNIIDETDRLKKQALSKLTKQDKIILGIVDVDEDEDEDED